MYFLHNCLSPRWLFSQPLDCPSVPSSFFHMQENGAYCGEHNSRDVRRQIVLPHRYLLRYMHLQRVRDNPQLCQILHNLNVAYAAMDLLSNRAVFSTSRNASPEPECTCPDLASDRSFTSYLFLSNLDTIKEALSRCDRTHSCKDQNALSLPTRLIDTGRHGTDEPRIIICSDEIDPTITASVPYVALSYCWGTCPALKSTRANLATRKRGFAISDMPLTLRDAVRATRDLGLRYLWVDALCILQDCREDWQRESARMGDVYGHAFLTIFAFGARDCEGGLFSPVGQKEHFSWEIPHFQDEPLNQRAWALQEWYLSPRRLIFTFYHVTFDCYQGPPRRFGSPVDKQVSLSPVDKQILPPTSMLESRDWDSLVSNYSSRALTNPLDKLPAIAGLAQRLDKLSQGQNGRYLSGLWEAHLPCSLLWRRQDSSWKLPGPTLTRPSAYQAPSWSWASFNGGIEFIEGQYRAGLFSVIARVTQVHPRLAMDSDPLGPSVYRLSICSPVKSLEKNHFREVRAEPLSPANRECTRVLWVSTTTAVDIRGDISDMLPFLEDARALKFCAVARNREDGRVWGLLLLQVDHATFQRIGCGWCFWTWFEDAVESVLEII